MTIELNPEQEHRIAEALRSGAYQSANDVIERALGEYEVQTVFHLAAIPSVPRSIDSPLLSHQVNIDGTFNVFRACV